MKTFKELYDELVSSTLRGDKDMKAGVDYDAYQLDCLLNPRKHPLVIKAGGCDCPQEKASRCVERCPFGAISENGAGGIKIDPELCFGCARCIDGCESKKLVESTETVAALKAVRSSEGPAYALIAPAFLGQFSSEVTPGKLRTALKRLGFDGMLEVALFADILTLKEALEFDRNIRTEQDYQLTSCCCPMWIAMIRKVYNELMPHVPGSVSPMVACGRTVKLLHPDATTVFIGPCLAKKAEAREKDLTGAVDFVLTFREVQDIFEALGVDPAALEDSEKDHSSRGGRIYARKGGVSEAVEKTLDRLNPKRPVSIRTKQADGVPACREMMNELLAGKQEANFYEGMGCVGGCVGGPRSVTGAEKGTTLVEAYGDRSPYATPVENPYVIELLRRLGIDTIEELLEDTDVFTRRF
ncbi:MAG: [Fe-Fe] hydrogenase large subunit C-terminal domain-containing protein [Oscillospiraceae bacterium]|nr:[Fe-Fe] hydrogenase large subunit C-terminal domain-containing protein [Oscillospiraceae bacterium]